ncbi:hypothetical protein K443DRAFT_101793 [Laccaria amethystina LaAM-08-1]|uniref:Methyltransferase type 11 domain-containing protein n=1 Tax=Laccaria amethystina LaAM-08-1 TaxID=1095629 RepID=A0A0C9XPW2_9AGAR|nr:hypothetical protein K443DRAFT_101793 [Laccaria amethystina LaAM-08-1]
MSSSSHVHDIAKSGFGTGTNELYNTIRPSYQAPALSFIRQAVDASHALNIVEWVPCLHDGLIFSNFGLRIGAGTGIFTRALLAQPEWDSSINEIRAIEPSEGMRSIFSKTVNDERVSINKGTFDASGIENGWANLIVVAQAFHWCPNYELAAAEFDRILKPKGTLALIWNLEDRQAFIFCRDGAEWVAQVRERIERHEEGTPQFRLGLWRQVYNAASYQKAFRAPHEQTWSYNLEATANTVIDRASSKSYIAVLPPAVKAEVQQDLRRILADGEKIWVDKKLGVFEYPYETLVVIAQKL